ncbi:MAG: septum formation inhibitor Maf [Halioglobus sp.]|nr:septum formation inhibitor Maf [Halioglobus sp.]
MTNTPLHLASASPRRRDILTGLGIPFSFSGEDVDEQALEGESAATMVLRLAHDKAAAALPARQGTAILGADTAVVLGDRIFGKPGCRHEAMTMLAELSGRTHEVMTGVVLLSGDEQITALCRTEVRFRAISPAESSAYWESGEPLDKAGGYAIQGLAAVFVSELRGSYSGVMGLPVFETAAMLRAIGIEVLGRQSGRPRFD